MMQLIHREQLKQSWNTVTRNGLRSMISVLSIGIGIASVAIIAIISISGKSYVMQEMKSYGLETLWIYRDAQSNNPMSVKREGSGISNDDLSELRQNCCTLVKRFSPSVYLSDWIQAVQYKSQFVQAAVEGVGYEYPQINNDRILYGRYFTEQEIIAKRNVAVIGPALARKLFNSRQKAIGQTLRVNGLSLVVIGILEEKKRKLLDALGVTDGLDINSRVLLPYTLYQTITGNKDIHTLLAQATSLEQADLAVQQIIDFLNKRNLGRYQYKGETMREWVSTSDRIITTITVIGFGAAAITLVLGGLGTASLMSNAVTERTHEIGLRKALGATSKDIHNQFLTESVVISTLGGLLGILLCSLFVLWVMLATDFKLVGAILIIMAAVTLSVLLGVVSGVTPAKKAASLQPADALRYE